MRSRGMAPKAATLLGLALCLGLSAQAEPAQATSAQDLQLAELCTIDAVPAPGGFGGKLRRREKPPDYLLPKKDDEGEQQQSTPASATTVALPAGTTSKLTELKAIFTKGLIDEGEYEATQLRILADISPSKSGVEKGLRMLRQLWDQSLITPAPYATKRKEMLDAL